MPQYNKPAPASTLTEAGENAAIELTETDLKDAAGGLTFNGIQSLADKSGPKLAPVAVLSAASKI